MSVALTSSLSCGRIDSNENAACNTPGGNLPDASAHIEIGEQRRQPALTRSGLLRGLRQRFSRRCRRGLRRRCGWRTRCLDQHGLEHDALQSELLRQRRAGRLRR